MAGMMTVLTVFRQPRPSSCTQGEDEFFDAEEEEVSGRSMLLLSNSIFL